MPAPVKLLIMPPSAAIAADGASAVAPTPAGPTAVSPVFALVCISLLFCVSLACALAPLRLSQQLHSRRLFLLTDAFAAGVLSSAAFVHMLPSASVHLSHHAYPWAGLLALAGAATVHTLEAAAGDAQSKGGVGVGHRSRTGAALAGALSVHALLEGLALGASTLRRRTFGAILLAIALHKAFAALSLGAALATSGLSDWTSSRLALVFAANTPVGALLGLIVVRAALTPAVAKTASAGLTAVSAGVFAYVAFAELLPLRGERDARKDGEGVGARGGVHGEATRNERANAAGALRYGACASPRRRAEPAVMPQDELVRAVVFIAAAAAMSVLAIWV